TNAVGSSAMFSVGATGAPPLLYQWRFNSVDRPGATNATLVIANVQTTKQGNYSVVVTEVGGLSVTSVVARLYVGLPRSFTRQPTNQIAEVGDIITFSALAGPGPISYQWRFNDEPLPGKTNTYLYLRNVQLTNAGAYTVVARNTYGSTTSTGATLT